MIFNYLRSNDEQNVGFTTDPRRVNVAITRSRRSLIICGSKQTLIGNTIWQDLLRDLIDLSPEIDFPQIESVQIIDDRQLVATLPLSQEINFKIGKLIGGKEVRGTNSVLE